MLFAVLIRLANMLYWFFLLLRTPSNPSMTTKCYFDGCMPYTADET